MIVIIIFLDSSMNLKFLRIDSTDAISP